MRRFWLLASCATLSFCLSTLSRAEEPLKVSVCELQTDPSSYNHKLVEVEGFVSHGFEDFSLFDPGCADSMGIWLEYGGTRKSNTVYCCGPTAGTSRKEELKIEGIPVPLVDDDQFKRFDREIKPAERYGYYGALVRAALVGRFFAGRKETYPSGKTAWAGYGHMGCCSLLAIQEVRSVTAHDRGNLDYGASADRPDINRKGCSFRNMTKIYPWQEEIKAQQRAEQDSNSQAFDDPERVAEEFLAVALKLDASQPPHLSEKRKARGRVVYDWSSADHFHSYMVVVSRPFLLSFYAKDPKRVAWVVIAAYDSSCGTTNSVTRIK
jgi:hypothetical protein